MVNVPQTRMVQPHVSKVTPSSMMTFRNWYSCSGSSCQSSVSHKSPSEPSPYSLPGTQHSAGGSASAGVSQQAKLATDHMASRFLYRCRPIAVLPYHCCRLYLIPDTHTASRASMRTCPNAAPAGELAVEETRQLDPRIRRIRSDQATGRCPRRPGSEPPSAYPSSAGRTATGTERTNLASEGSSDMPRSRIARTAPPNVYAKRHERRRVLRYAARSDLY